LNSIGGLGVGSWELGDEATRLQGDKEIRRSGRRPSLVTGHPSPCHLVILSLILVFTLVACGSSVTQTAQTERYTIEIMLDSASFGERTATIMVNDRSGQPAAVDQVVLAPVMVSMGMASPEITAQPSAPGRYQVKGDFFSMIGEWQMNVRVSAAGKDDMAHFLFQVQQ
jgi:YtkA-like